MSDRTKAFLVCLFFVIIVIVAALIAGLFLIAVNDLLKAETRAIKTQMVVTAANPSGNFEPALQTQYINDGTICIIGLKYNAIWIDQSGGCHEVPTEYMVVK
jgi:hypothetical protein